MSSEPRSLPGHFVAVAVSAVWLGGVMGLMLLGSHTWAWHRLVDEPFFRPTMISLFISPFACFLGSEQVWGLVEGARTRILAAIYAGLIEG